MEQARSRLEVLEEKKAKLEQMIKEEQQREKERLDKALKKRRSILYSKVAGYAEAGWPDDYKALKTELTKILKEV